MLCGEAAVSLITVRVAFWLPVAVGVKLKMMAQLPEAETLVPHVLVWVNSLAAAPLIITLCTLNVKGLWLASVTVWVALVVVTGVPGKVTVAGSGWHWHLRFHSA
jgi:hypothetical protein